MDVLWDFLQVGVVGNFTWGNMAMLAIGAVFIWLGIARDYEPLLLVPDVSLVGAHVALCDAFVLTGEEIQRGDGRELGAQQHHDRQRFVGAGADHGDDDDADHAGR